MAALFNILSQHHMREEAKSGLSIKPNGGGEAESPTRAAETMGR